MASRQGARLAKVRSRVAMRAMFRPAGGSAKDSALLRQRVRAKVRMSLAVWNSDPLRGRVFLQQVRRRVALLVKGVPREDLEVSRRANRVALIEVEGRQRASIARPDSRKVERKNPKEEHQRQAALSKS